MIVWRNNEMFAVPWRGKTETAVSDCARWPPQRHLHQTDHIPDSTGRITARAAQTDLHRQQNKFSRSGRITGHLLNGSCFLKNTSYANWIQTRINGLCQLSCEHGPPPPLGAIIKMLHPVCACGVLEVSAPVRVKLGTLMNQTLCGGLGSTS